MRGSNDEARTQVRWARRADTVVPHAAVEEMSDSTYTDRASGVDKPRVWLYGQVKSPPFSREARLEAGFLLRKLQRGESLGLPLSRPLPAVGARCHELRIVDADASWRIVYRVDADAVVIVDVFRKKSRATPRSVSEVCRKRIREYDDA